ncbi:MAG: hypothetical protein R3F56_22220 [Planctomycetota bacterium]
MGSHTSPSASHQNGDEIQVEPIDPLHDIDGTKTLVWVSVFVILVFGGVWLLGGSFGYFLDQEQKEKVWDREPTELKALRAQEDDQLHKQEDLGGGKQRISIEEAMRRLAEQK